MGPAESTETVVDQGTSEETARTRKAGQEQHVEAAPGSGQPGPASGQPDPASGPPGPSSPAHPGSEVREQDELYTDARSGFWAGTTTIFCIAVAAVGNLVLLAAALGQSAIAGWSWGAAGAAMWCLVVGLPIGFIVGLLRLVLSKRDKLMSRIRLTMALEAAAIGALVTGIIVFLLYGVAWMAAKGEEQFAWQPVVGFTMSVVAVASFGGYYLASRRSRVGIAASFLLTFLVLLSFMLTLDGLARAVGGSDDTEAVQAGAKVIQDLLRDFRGSVGLIIAFYFGTDAAVSAVKILKTQHGDAQDLGRLDRDLAVPHPRSG